MTRLDVRVSSTRNRTGETGLTSNFHVNRKSLLYLGFPLIKKEKTNNTHRNTFCINIYFDDIKSASRFEYFASFYQ